jgi:hypothetical protein
LAVTGHFCSIDFYCNGVEICTFVISDWAIDFTSFEGCMAVTQYDSKVLLLDFEIMEVDDHVVEQLDEMEVDDHVVEQLDEQQHISQHLIIEQKSDLEVGKLIEVEIKSQVEIASEVNRDFDDLYGDIPI